MSTRVLIQGPWRAQYIRMFMDDPEFTGVDDINDADLVCFTGGEDVDPSLYGEKAIPGLYTNLDRDHEDCTIFGQCLALDIPMVGICRGGQFLNVMNAGKMWQDVDQHGKPHYIQDTLSRKVIWASSTHHQQMRPGPDAEVVAYAKPALEGAKGLTICTRKKAYGDGWDFARAPSDPDVEIVFYAETNSLCFQPHPELPGYPALREYFFTLLERYDMTLRAKDAA